MEAPGKGRSQFRRESGARLNPREAGPELEGEGPWAAWRACRSPSSRFRDDGGRRGPNVCPSAICRPTSEPSAGHEDPREAGSRESGGDGGGQRGGSAQAPRLRRPRPQRPLPPPSCLFGAARIGAGGRGPGSAAGPAPAASYWSSEGVLLTPSAYWRARADAAPHWSVPIWAPNSKILKVPAGAF